MNRWHTIHTIHTLAVCLMLFMVHCEWCSVAMAQTGSEFRVRLFLEAPLGKIAVVAPREPIVRPISIRVAANETVLLLRSGDEATTMVRVVIEVTEPTADIMMTVSSGNAEVVSIPSITIETASDDTKRIAQISFTAKKAGEALVTLVVTDNVGNRDETQLRLVVVAECVGDCLPEMVIVPAGNFIMGVISSEEATPYYRGVAVSHSRAGDPDYNGPHFEVKFPQRRVTISTPFAVGKYEVTIGQYRAFVDATGYKVGTRLAAWELGPDSPLSDAHPVSGVTWDDAKAYIGWLSATTGQQYRLLSDEEWEYVARAGTTDLYQFGNTIRRGQANYNSYEGGGAVAVGNYPANAFGVHDMHGNVPEWVEDCWFPNLDVNVSLENFSGFTWMNTYLPHDGYRCHRGGHWINEAAGVTALWKNPSTRKYSGAGFRVARTLLEDET